MVPDFPAPPWTLDLFEILVFGVWPVPGNPLCISLDCPLSRLVEFRILLFLCSLAFGCFLLRYYILVCFSLSMFIESSWSLQCIYSLFLFNLSLTLNTVFSLAQQSHNCNAHPAFYCPPEGNLCLQQMMIRATGNVPDGIVTVPLVGLFITFMIIWVCTPQCDPPKRRSIRFLPPTNSTGISKAVKHAVYHQSLFQPASTFHTHN